MFLPADGLTDDLLVEGIMVGSADGSDANGLILIIVRLSLMPMFPPLAVEGLLLALFPHRLRWRILSCPSIALLATFKTAIMGRGTAVAM